MDLKNAAVLVTGGSCGIGFETARLLRERGARVAICARHRDMLESAAQQLGTFPIVADVSNEDDVLRMVREVVKEYKDYSVLINNAGFGAFTPLVDLTAEEFFRVWQTNVLGKVDRRSHRRGPTIQPSFTRKTSLVSSSACWRPRIVGLSPSPPFGLRTPNKTATERVTVN